MISSICFMFRFLLSWMCHQDLSIKGICQSLLCPLSVSQWITNIKFIVLCFLSPPSSIFILQSRFMTLFVSFFFLFFSFAFSTLVLTSLVLTWIFLFSLLHLVCRVFTSLFSRHSSLVSRLSHSLFLLLLFPLYLLFWFSWSEVVHNRFILQQGSLNR